MTCALRVNYALWRVKRLWYNRDTDTAAVVSIMSGVLWAILLAAPGDTLARPTYKYMAKIAPEPIWVAVFMLMAGLQCWRLFGRPFRRHYYVDFAIKTLAMILWWFVATACMASQWPLAAAMSDTYVVAIATLWDWLRYDPRQSCPDIPKDCAEANCPIFRKGAADAP